MNITITNLIIIKHQNNIDVYCICCNITEQSTREANINWHTERRILQ